MTWATEKLLDLGEFTMKGMKAMKFMKRVNQSDCGALQ
jgi:hypothetical protein